MIFEESICRFSRGLAHSVCRVVVFSSEGVHLPVTVAWRNGRRKPSSKRTVPGQALMVSLLILKMVSSCFCCDSEKPSGSCSLSRSILARLLPSHDSQNSRWRFTQPHSFVSMATGGPLTNCVYLVTTS